jgi:nucleotide-binding universal stress UspA family protein
LGALLYQKILVPIDGSDHSKRALSEAIRIAKMTNGNITLLNVQSNRSRIAPANQAITDAKNSIVLNDGNFDLIVVGARGLSKFEELLLGSVSHGVVENSPCPVIVTR